MRHASNSLMLLSTNYGSASPAFVMMPFLAGSQREWASVIEFLSPKFRCITLDLPGFGAAADVTGYSVEDMARKVIDTLASLSIGPYLLAGHSMAGKVSAVVTRTLLNDSSRMHPPAGLVLVAPSPPSPEPMSDAKRAQMLSFFASATELSSAVRQAKDRTDAETYVSNNLGQAIPRPLFDRTVDDVLLMNRNAWRAWLTSGSKEDWSSFVGLLDLPALIVAGTQDEALGPESQRKHTLPHFTAGSLAELECSHLVPLERPRELAELIETFVQSSGLQTSASIMKNYRELIASSRVSPQTRKVLLDRGQPDNHDYVPQALTADSLRTLRGVLACVVPQGGGEDLVPIDLAARLDRELAEGKGDGWRYAVLPPDATAYALGLSLLNEFAEELSSIPFHQLTAEKQDSLLDAVANGRLQSPHLDMKRWFEDLCAAAVQIYVAHPQTLALMGYSGIADDPNGFVQLGEGKTEAWEPRAQ